MYLQNESTYWHHSLAESLSGAKRNMSTMNVDPQ